MDIHRVLRTMLQSVQPFFPCLHYVQQQRKGHKNIEMCLASPMKIPKIHVFYMKSFTIKFRIKVLELSGVTKLYKAYGSNY